MKHRIISTPLILASLIAAVPDRPLGEAVATKAPRSKKSTPVTAGEGLENTDPPLTIPDTKPIPSEMDVMVKIKDLKLDADTQARVSLDAETVEKYRGHLQDAKLAKEPNPFPAIDVVRDRDGKLYPFDGFQRTEAHSLEKEKEIKANLYDPPEGWSGKDYAFILSLGANETHGKPRTTGDRKLAIKRAHQKWGAQVSNVQIANMVGVSEATVRNYRPATESTTRVTKRDGKTVTIKTGNIGRKTGAGAAKKAAAKAAKEAKAQAKADKAAAKAAGKPAPAQKENGSTPPPALASSNKADEERRKFIIKISDAQPTDRAAEVRNALENNTLNLTLGDYRTLAETSPSRIRQLTPLVFDKRWKPSKAVSFIDKAMDGKTTLDDIATLLLTKPDKRSETVAGLEISIGSKSIEIRLSEAAISQ